MFSRLKALALICLFGGIGAVHADSTEYVAQEIVKTRAWIEGRLPSLMEQEILPRLTTQELKELQGYRFIVTSDSGCSTRRDPAFVERSSTGPVVTICARNVYYVFQVLQSSYLALSSGLPELVERGLIRYSDYVERAAVKDRRATLLNQGPTFVCAGYVVFFMEHLGIDARTCGLDDVKVYGAIAHLWFIDPTGAAKSQAELSRALGKTLTPEQLQEIFQRGVRTTYDAAITMIALHEIAHVLHGDLTPQRRESCAEAEKRELAADLRTHEMVIQSKGTTEPGFGHFAHMHTVRFLSRVSDVCPDEQTAPQLQLRDRTMKAEEYLVRFLSGLKERLGNQRWQVLRQLRPEVDKTLEGLRRNRK